MIIIKTLRGSYLPKSDKDLAVFKHCCNGSIEVAKQDFGFFVPLFAIHKVKIIVELQIKD